MPKSVEPTGHVHWLGAGLSTGSGLRQVAAGAHKLTLWNRTKATADALVEHLGLQDSVSTAELDQVKLGRHLSAGDIIVCMLPVALHPDVLQIALHHKVHYVSSSYTNGAVAAVAGRMKQAGLSCLVEAGLDPGIDHLLAHRLVQDATIALGDKPVSVRFTSWCGGVPAVANPFRYKFSWAPAGVLLALASPANWIEKNTGQWSRHPWDATRTVALKDETFEAYPNRDSLPFVAQYGLPDHWEIDTFVRGTLRLEGWQSAWADVFPVVAEGDRTEITRLAEQLALENPFESGEPDRVVMRVALDASVDDATLWSQAYEIDVTGTAFESAMARTVSAGLALGVLDTLDGLAPAGLSHAVSAPGDIARWLDRLTEWGVIGALSGSRSGALTCVAA